MEFLPSVQAAAKVVRVAVLASITTSLKPPEWHCSIITIRSSKTGSSASLAANSEAL